MKILMGLTSHDQIGNTGQRTGFWLEAFAAPYYIFKDAGLEVGLASPAGGQPPLDPKSNEPDTLSESTQRYYEDLDVQRALSCTCPLTDVCAEEYDAVFYPGGHGTLWDLANDQQSIAMIEEFSASAKPHGFVCHAPAALRSVKRPDGAPLVAGRNVTGFSNSEEEAVGLATVVPFLLETELNQLGGVYSKAADWQSHVVADGLLVTGQNPASSTGVALAMISLFDRESA